MNDQSCTKFNQSESVLSVFHCLNYDKHRHCYWSLRGNVWFLKVCAWNVLHFIFKHESVRCSGRPNDQRPPRAPPSPSPLNSPSPSLLPWRAHAVLCGRHGNSVSQLPLLPSSLHDHLYACSKLMFGERKKKTVFSTEEERRALGDLPSVDRRRGVPRTRREEHMKGFLVVTWHVGNVKCMWTKIGEQCRLLPSSTVSCERQCCRLPPPDRRRKTLFVCISLLEQLCAFIAAVDCCVSAWLCACPHVHCQGCPHVFRLSHFVYYFLFSLFLFFA